MELSRVVLLFALTTAGRQSAGPADFAAQAGRRLLPANFPSELDTLAYVDALKHSNFSQWRSLEEVSHLYPVFRSIFVPFKARGPRKAHGRDCAGCTRRLMDVVRIRCSATFRTVKSRMGQILPLKWR